MVIKYVSPHDSPDDPGGLIREVIDMGPEFPGPAEDILVAWTLRLADGLDPAEAAARLLAAYGIAEGAAPDNAAGKVVTLLRQAAQSPRQHLNRRRQGGRRGRTGQG